MPTPRVTESIEPWTLYDEGRVGFRMRFTDGTSELHLFDQATALALCTQGKTLLEALQQAARVAQAPSGVVGIGEAVHMRLVKSGE